MPVKLSLDVLRSKKINQRCISNVRADKSKIFEDWRSMELVEEMSLLYNPTEFDPNWIVCLVG